MIPLLTKKIPSLDLHGETTSTIVYLIRDFINDNISLENEYISIIHGKGSGALKRKTHEILKSHQSVLDFKINMWNDGETIVKLKLK